MGLESLIFAVDVLITTFCMFIASKLSFVTIDVKSVLIIAVLVSLVSLVPVVGWILGLILFVYLISKAAHANIGDCIWVVLFTKLVSAGVFVALGSQFA